MKVPGSSLEFIDGIAAAAVMPMECQNGDLCNKNHKCVTTQTYVPRELEHKFQRLQFGKVSNI